MVKNRFSTAHGIGRSRGLLIQRAAIQRTQNQIRGESAVSTHLPLDSLARTKIEVPARNATAYRFCIEGKEDGVEGFKRRLEKVQQAYRARRKAFDGLFSDRPYDTKGSGAYRWSCVLKRLDRCSPEELAAKLKNAAEC
jgi:hypothetical protein